MNLVAVFLADEMMLRRLAVAFRTRCAVQSFDSVEAVQKAVTSGRVISIVVDMRGHVELPGTTALELIAQLHSYWPSIPVVGYIDFTPQRAREILAAAHAGATEIILADTDELDTVAGRIVDKGLASNIAARVDVAIREIVPLHLRDFFLC